MSARTAAPTALLGALVLGLGGCGGSDSPATPPSGPATASAPSSPPTSVPSSSPTSVPSTIPVPSFQLREDLPTRTPMRAAITVTGVVAEGVESGCLLLPGAGTTYLLLGDVPDDLVGREVTVRGRVQPTAVTTCQQGTPLVVQSVRPR